MATREVVNYCNEVLLDGWKEYGTNKASKVELELLGVKTIVNSEEFKKLNDADKQHHRREDYVLLCFYDDDISDRIYGKYEGFESFKSI